MQPEDIENLIERYNAGNVTPEEKALVEIWYLKYKTPKPYLSHDQLEEDEEESLNLLVNQIQTKSKRVLWPQLAIAASILIFLTAGAYFLTFKKIIHPQYVAVNKPTKQDLAPGGNKAILTLANGSTIVLTGAKNGELASEDGTVVKKTSDGLISYVRSGGSTLSKELTYNTATTPRGGQYQFVLSDGTRVWLNSASSIKYPVEFIGNERKVELTGEAYFEVAHNAKKPFRVISNGQVVEVLGTHFNINAYSDEKAIKTTLLEGSVKVSSGAITNVIKPGEQAQLRNGSINVVRDVDLDAAVAWKNGLFHFEDNNIEDVMRQISRWYNVDIKYQGQLPPRLFSGEISRNVNASQILDILSFKKIHYRIDGKSIIITP
jgi:transmembrane sensor